jgi:threonylcarbamoyladenosine tRNA methylthiotransferase MtaB
MARGKSRSDTIARTVENVRKIAAEGTVKEIVLTGVNLGDFGKGPEGARVEPSKIGDAGKTGGLLPAGMEPGRTETVEPVSMATGRKEDFFGLMKELDTIEGIERYRISSIEPNLLSPEMIEWVAGSQKFMPHFHIPLQSGSDRILGLMRRRYKRDLYASRVELIKALMPHCAIGVDVIVGFPGETEEHFQETFEFLHELEVSYLHVFTYSERDHTKALEIKPVVPIAIRNERNKILRNLSYQKMQYFTRQHDGQVRKVLLEGHVKTGVMEGYTDNYIKVTTPYRPEWVNQVIDWKL